MNTIISQNKWVVDSDISALLDLIDKESILTLNGIFIKFLCRAKHHNVIQSVSDFRQYQYSLSGIHRLLIRLCNCQVALIPLFIGYYTGNGNHLGLVLLGKGRDLFEFQTQ